MHMSNALIFIIITVEHLLIKIVQFIIKVFLNSSSCKKNALLSDA